METALADADDVRPVNLFLHSLFSEVDISLNDTQITSSNNTYPYRAYLETLFSYGPDAKASQLSSSMYYKDTAGAMDEIAAVADDVPNKGLKARSVIDEGEPNGRYGWNYTFGPVFSGQVSSQQYKFTTSISS